MNEARHIDLARILQAIGDVEIVLICPDDPAAMLRHTRACRDGGVPFAADPSQQIARMPGTDLRELVDGARYLFTNEYERDLLVRKTGWPVGELLNRVGAWVTTIGPKGRHHRVARWPVALGRRGRASGRPRIRPEPATPSVPVSSPGSAAGSGRSGQRRWAARWPHW